MTEEAYRRIADEFAVREVLTRYCRAVDRCNLELLKSVYWPDATDDHHVYVGNAIKFADFIMPILKKSTECTMHMIGSIWLKLDGDICRSETYFHAYHRVPSGGSTLDVTIGGRYLDRLERRNGEWRISERTMVVDWEQNGAALMGGEEAMRKLLAIDRRSRDEDSYRLFA